MKTVTGMARGSGARQQRPSAHRRWLSGSLLPVFVVVSLLMLVVGPVAPALAVTDHHEGEETAQFLPADAALYLTVNLDPSADQLTLFRSFLGYWWQDPNVKARWAELLEESESESDIDIVNDVLPWLGPELAVGMGHMTNLTEEEEPRVVMFFGTMNKEASDAFLFDKFFPYMAEEEEIVPGDVPSAPTGSYEGIETLYAFPDESTYWAFTDDYVVLSFASDETMLESTLDLVLASNSAASLAGSADFQEAQAALPAERVGMFYCSCEDLLGGMTGMAGEDSSGMGELVETLGSQLPSYMAASLQFAGSGLSVTAYTPLPEGAETTSVGNNSLGSAAVVPADALLFLSEQDMASGWDEMRSELADNWDEFAPEDLPEGVETLDDLLDLLADEFGVDIDEDVFGWMTGEVSVALLSVTFDEDREPEGLDVMVTFEVEDPSAVEEHLANVIEGVNSFMEQVTPEGETPDLVETTTTTIGGVAVTMVTNDAITESGMSPGWLFLDVDGTDYLVLGSSEDALEAAVEAGQGEIPSLDEAEAYDGVLSLLPATRTSFAYVNLTLLLDTVVGLAPTDEMTADEESDFELACTLIPLECGLGFSLSPGDDGVSISGAIYLMPPPLAEELIAEGATQVVSIAERFIDFSDVNSAVGKCSVSLDVDISNAPAGAKINMTALKDLPEDVSSGFELAATDAGMTILDVAYGVRVDKTNLTDDNVGTATITMKVGREWADSYGIENVRVFRVSDGVSEVLPTSFVEYQDDYAVFEGVSENGLSYFGLVAVELPGGMNWALVGGLIGGLMVLAIVFLMYRRSRSVA